MLLVLLFVPYLLRLAGWRGHMDCGFSREQRTFPFRAARLDVGLGLVLGLGSLGLMIFIEYAYGTRALISASRMPAEVPAVIGYAFSALLIAVLEETIVRGVLFRLLQRLWTLWPAVLVSSMLFAYLHFLKASPDAFGDGPILEKGFAVMGSALSAPAHTEAFALRFLNLTLMSILLCLVVARTGTIWIAVGLHAGWVWLKKSNGALGDAVDGVGPTLWIGSRSDATDALLTTVVFLVLAAFVLRRPSLSIANHATEAADG